MDNISPELAAYIKQNCPEYANLGEDELLMMQESAFLHHGSKNLAGANFEVYVGRSGGRGGSGYSDDLLASDEALARALEEEFSSLSVDQEAEGDEAVARALAAEFEREQGSHGPSQEPSMGSFPESPTGSYSGQGSSFPQSGGGSSSTNTRGDNVDPDRMSYEELNQLGDAVGKEKKGVPVETMSTLPTFTYKGPSSSGERNKEAEECIICQSKFEKNENLTSLPCLHQYHTDCISRWLKDNKKCPVCQKDIES